MFYDMHLVFPLTAQGNVLLTDTYPHAVYPSQLLCDITVYIWMEVPQGS